MLLASDMWLVHCLTSCPSQMRVKAHDLGTPERVSTDANVVIKIGRNKFAPKFEKSAYEAKIRENLSRGSGVIPVKATDKDAGVSNIIIQIRAAGRLNFVIAINRG